MSRQDGLDAFEKSPIWDEWVVLADRFASNPFQRPEWVAMWLRSFGGSGLVLSEQRDGELVGVMPLIQNRLSTATPTNGDSYHFGSLTADDAAAMGLARSIVDQGRPKTSLLFPQGDPVLNAILDSEKSGLGAVVSRVELTSPRIDLTGSWDTFLERVPSRRRSEIRRRERRLSETGSLGLVVFEGEGDLNEHLSEFLRIESSGWKADQGTAIASRGESLRFYQSLAEWARDQGWLRIATLRLDGTTIAADLSLETDDSHYLLKTGFAPEFRRFGPGQLLRMKMIERCFNSGISSYEFMGTDEGGHNDWKSDWADDALELIRLVLYDASISGWIYQRVDRLHMDLRSKAVAWARDKLNSNTRRRLRTALARVRGPLR